MMNHASPLKEHEYVGDHIDDDDAYEEAAFPGNGCCCFSHSCFEWRQSKDREWKSLLGEQPKATWLGERLKEAKEASEVLAGPKWKNFIRKISKFFKKKKLRRGQFQYDPQSYALNFDDGVEEEDGSLLGFSSRLAGPVTGEERRPGL